MALFKPKRRNRVIKDARGKDQQKREDRYLPYKGPLMTDWRALSKLVGHDENPFISY